MKRRVFIGTVAAGVSGGCLDRSRLSTTPDHDMTISDVAVRPEVVVVAVDVYNSHGERDEQFVTAYVEVDEQPFPDPAEFAIVTNAERYTHSDAGIPRSWTLWNIERRYHNGEGRLGFIVPKPLDIDQATLTWPGGEYELDGAAMDLLRRPPTDFEVLTYEAPESMAPEESATLTLVVENVGGVDGRFVAGLTRVGGGTGPYPETGISTPVEAGETLTWEHEYGPYDPDRLRERDPFVKFRLDWRDGFEDVTTEFEIG